MNNSTHPQITDAMRDSARNARKPWIYVIDPEYAPEGENGAIPPEGIQGAFPVAPNGEIIEEFTANPHYRELPPAKAIAKHQKSI